MADAYSIGALDAPVSDRIHPKRDPRSHRESCRKYERYNPRGFLMRAYRNMQSRVTGIQFLKHHLYAGKELLSREDFYRWSTESEAFSTLFDVWTASGHDRRLCPSVDRIDSSRGYTLDNMRWVTFTENCKNIQRKRTKIARATVCPEMLEAA